MRRRDQNQGRRDYDEFRQAIEMLDPIITTVLLRGTHDSGIRRALPDVEPGDSETPPWNDETGETAIRQPQGDTVEKRIEALVALVHNALNIAKGIIEITSEDDLITGNVAVKSVPDCPACGDPCYGGVRNGFDDKCRKRWDRMGRPDRGEFIALVVRERDQTVANG